MNDCFKSMVAWSGFNTFVDVHVIIYNEFETAYDVISKIAFCALF